MTKIFFLFILLVVGITLWIDGPKIRKNPGKAKKLLILALILWFVTGWIFYLLKLMKFAVTAWLLLVITTIFIVKKVF